jgi:hypothetical protein
VLAAGRMRGNRHFPRAVGPEMPVKGPIVVKRARIVQSVSETMALLGCSTDRAPGCMF